MGDSKIKDAAISLPRREVVHILRDLETLVVSLDRIGSETTSIDAADANRIISAFVTEWDVFGRLAHARQILSEAFPTEYGDDDMEQLERLMADVEHWSPTNTRPTKRSVRQLGRIEDEVVAIAGRFEGRLDEAWFQFRNAAEIERLKNQSSQDVLVVSIDAAVSSKQGLFDRFGREVNAPNGYFGDNWDAFNDCFYDLNWSSQHTVCVVHETLPQLDDEQLRIYLEILCHIVEDHQSERMAEHLRRFPDLLARQFVVVFRASDQAAIRSVCGAARR